MATPAMATTTGADAMPAVAAAPALTTPDATDQPGTLPTPEVRKLKDQLAWPAFCVDEALRDFNDPDDA
eukprot:4175453-Lingulodinium_polyedra.AAC.1